MPRSAAFIANSAGRDGGRSIFAHHKCARQRGQGGRPMGARIAIVGTGAVGGYAGAHMAQAGEDVTFVDFWPENVETIRAKGLRVSHLRDVPEFTTAARALHVTELQRFSKEKPIDIAFICTKSYDTAWATA